MYDIYGNSKLTGHYGDKRSYYKQGKFHEGDDIAKAMNSPINAVADGTVLKIAYDPKGYGNYIDIQHDNGLITRYAHANGFDVKKGDKVSEGQIIGKVGSTGRSTGPHIHFEAIKDGKKINPKDINQYFVLSQTVKPKGIKTMENNSNTNNGDLDNLKNQIVQMQMKRFELTPEEEELKKETIVSLMNQLQNPVEMPRYLTIQDLFKKNNDLTGVVPSFNPEMQRGINELFGTKVFNPRTGRVEDLGEDLPRRTEAQMQAEQVKAQEQQKIQNLLAGNVYKTMNSLDEEAMREDRFNRQMAMQNEQFNQRVAAAEKAAEAQAKQQAFENEMREKELELKQKKLEAELADMGLSTNADGVLTGGASPVKDVSKVKFTAADRKQLTENKTTLKNIEAGLASLDKNPDAYTLWKGLLPADVTNRLDPKGVATRTQIDNITAVYRKWLTGAQMSDRERKAYERFLPAPTDNYNIVKAKLNGMKGAIERSNEALLSNYGITETEKITPDSVTVKDTVKKDSLGLGI